jgi:hypothetical protein
MSLTKQKLRLNYVWRIDHLFYLYVLATINIFLLHDYVCCHGNHLKYTKYVVNTFIFQGHQRQRHS